MDVLLGALLSNRAQYITQVTGRYVQLIGNGFFEEAKFDKQAGTKVARSLVVVAE